MSINHLSFTVVLGDGGSPNFGDFYSGPVEVGKLSQFIPPFKD